MRTKSVTVFDVHGNAVTVTIREMTRAEMRRYDLPPKDPQSITVEELLQAACTAPAATALDDVPMSHLRSLCDQISDLTYGSEESLGNLPSTGVPSSTPSAASTATLAAN